MKRIVTEIWSQKEKKMVTSQTKCSLKNFDDKFNVKHIKLFW